MKVINTDSLSADICYLSVLWSKFSHDVYYTKGKAITHKAYEWKITCGE